MCRPIRVGRACLPRVHAALLDRAEVRPAQRVLEIGCGPGDLLMALGRRVPGAELTGIDPDLPALRRARRKASRRNIQVRFERAYADELPYPDDSFDRVLSSYMLHHLDAEQQVAAMREVARVLRPGGAAPGRRRPAHRGADTDGDARGRPGRSPRERAGAGRSRPGPLRVLPRYRPLVTLFDPAPAKALVRRHAEVDYPYVREFGGAEIAVDEGVFCPLLTRTSPILLDAVDFRAGDRVLDVFSGSGAFGIVAALRGGRVVTVDRSPAAVACTRRNAVRNRVADRVDARLGDFTGPSREAPGIAALSRGAPGIAALSRGALGIAAGECFDLVIANPPLLPGVPETALEAALFDPDLGATTTFLSVLPSLLADGGRAYLLTSDVLERYGLKVESPGLTATLVDERDAGYERYRVHRITR